METTVKSWKKSRLIRDIDIYLNITLALVVAILGILDILNDKVIFSTILGLLALVAVSLLVNRRDNVEIQDALAALQNLGSAPDRFLVMEYSREDIFKRIGTSREIYMWGTALEAHIPLLKDHLKERMHDGLNVKCLLVKPNSSAVAMAAFRGKLKPEVINSILERNLSILVALANENTPGKLEFRVVDYLAPYTMYIFDPQLPDGYLLAPLSTFRIDNIHKRPTFKLICKRDELWFRYFVQQFEKVWSEAELYDVKIHQFE